MSDENLDGLDPSEGGTEPPFDDRFHFACHGAMAGFALLTGVVSFVAVLGLSIPTLKRLFEETGMVLPATTEFVISYNLHVLGPGLGLVAALAIAGSSILKHPKLTLPVGLASLIVCFIPMSACVLHALGARYGMEEMLLRTDTGRGEIEPGRTSEIADEVVRGIRFGLARGVGTFQTPSGAQRRYFVAEGPGLPDAPRELPPYEQARKLPGCVVLPWADGPEPNGDSSREVVLFSPAGVPGGIAPRALEGAGEAPWTLLVGGAQYVTQEETPTYLHPATHPVPGSDYSWALWLRRARVDANGDGVVSAGPRPSWRPSTEPAKPADPYRDGLLEVRVELFRAFDPAANPTQPGEYVPRTNVPMTTFVSLVDVP